jgi:drug/metabolite transporter (DMT)-like permease
VNSSPSSLTGSDSVIQALPVKQHAANQPVLAAILTLSSLLCFACMDSTIKYLVASYNVPLVVAIRFIVNCLVIIVLFAPLQGPKALVKTQRTGLVLLRAACLTFTSVTMALALQQLPVAEATSIIFLSPLLLLLLARLFLNETIGALGWLATLIGFVGVMLIVEPSNGLSLVGVAYALCAMFANTIYQLLSRVLASTETTLAMLFYSTLVGTLSFGIVLPWYWYGMPPTWLQIGLFISVGVLGGAGHYLFTAAFRYAPASFIAPLTYFQLIWAGLLGWLVFNHIPTALSMIGMCLVVMSGLIMLFKMRLASKAAKLLAP